MRTLFICGFLLAGAAPGAVVLDRVAAIVGGRVVKLSDVERDLRVTQFLNREPIDTSPAARRKAADRLVDQQLIRDEVSSGGYGRATDAEAVAMLEKVRRERYGNSELRLRQELSRYGLTEGEMRAHLLWQLTVLRFIEERFRPGVLATDEEVRAYYDQHAELHKAAFDAAAPDVRRTIEGERVNQQFDAWLTGERKRVTVEYRGGAFQ